jgi:hypothetical protein
MRYSIMLQVVGIITLILVGTAGLFAWLQNREVPPSSEVSRGERPFART